MNNIRYVIRNARDEKISIFVAFYRFFRKRCLDCGAKLEKYNERGDVCEKCYDNFNGITVEELTAGVE